MTLTIKSALHSGATFLSATSPSPELDARFLLQFLLQCEGAYLLTWPEQALSETEAQQWQALLTRRAQGEPVAYIVGFTEFWSMPIRVTRDTLIPRSDTETLVEAVLNTLDNKGELSLCELGTGSGAIALALAHSCPRWRITAVEKSPAALRIAKSNARHLGITTVQWLASDWFSAVPPQKFAALISNPPYIRRSDPHLLALSYEPRSALLAGESGLDDLQYLIREGRAYLEPGGYVFLEHGFDQAEAVQHCFLQNQYVAIQTLCDLTGHARVTYAQYNAKKTL